MTSAADMDRLPTELCALRQWVLWRGVEKTHKTTGEIKVTKVPYTVHLRLASSTNPDTWTSFSRVCQALPLALEEWEADTSHPFHGGGLGFVFTPEDPYVGIDLDGCLDTAGHLSARAQHVLEGCATYAEYSPSGTGVHLLARGVLPHAKKLDWIELYDRGRFFTMTGHHIEGTPAHLADAQAFLDKLLAEIDPPRSQRDTSAAQQKPLLTDEALLNKATHAKNAPKFLSLWRGDITAYPSHSEAVAALCALLAFWTDDAAQVDRLFRQSGLYTQKWDDARGEQTYGERTLRFTMNGAFAHGAPPSTDTPPAPQDVTWREGLILQERKGTPVECIPNIALLLRHTPGLPSLWWDSFAQVPMADEAVLDDAGIIGLAQYLGQRTQMPINRIGNFKQCLYHRCREDQRDPLRLFIEGLQWDGVERLSAWLPRYCQAPPTLANQWIGRTLLCALVARACDPGCMQRAFVILEGGENIGKSALVELLGAPWARTLARNVDTKDAQMLLRGCWVMEVPELDAFSKSEESRIKAFLTDRSDSIILKYENHPTTYLRRTVLIGTVNPDGTGYLKGQTGNTRYLPVRCGTIDLEGVRAVRDQLLAEAKTLLVGGYRWWEEPEEAKLADVREERRADDIFEERIAAWLENTMDHEHLDSVSMEEVMRRALAIVEPERWKDRGLQMRVGVIIRRCGWQRYKARSGGHLAWRYRRVDGT